MRLLSILALCVVCSITRVQPCAAALLPIYYIEAEAFDDFGGWVLDTQFMDQMGSPFLLAHELGVPVKDAVTKVRVAQPGTYHVFVRTRDWVATWKAKGSPGRFQVLVRCA